MAYDKAEWHYGGDFPNELPHERGATHIGMFLAWVIIRRLEGDRYRDDSVYALAAVRARQITGRQFLVSECDETFTDENLNDEGNAFAEAYYNSDDPQFSYLADYVDTLASDVPSAYHVDDTWQNFDKVATVLDRRFTEWKALSGRVAPGNLTQRLPRNGA